jgi:hypothetical protein
MPAISKSPTARTGIAAGSRLSLATKLYSIFALFAFLTAAITALSDYNTRRSRSSRNRSRPPAARRSMSSASIRWSTPW